VLNTGGNIALVNNFLLSMISFNTDNIISLFYFTMLTVINVRARQRDLERPRFTTYAWDYNFIKVRGGRREIFIRHQIIIGGIMYLFLETK
jgi:hypothetical protein